MNGQLIPWTTSEVVVTALFWAAYILSYLYVYPKVKSLRPHWEGRAEIATAIGTLVLLTLLVS